jgi:ketosteroid isomerase-like protein
MTEPDQRASATVAEWRAASESLDARRATACLAGNAVLISPLTASFTFDGREQVADVLAAAFQVIQEIRFHTKSATRALARCSTAAAAAGRHSRKPSCSGWTTPA